jgi:MFS family permease
LAVGAGATAALSAVQGGLPTLGAAIQETFELSLVEVTAVFTAFALGTLVTPLAWGALSDRVGERWVIASAAVRWRWRRPLRRTDTRTSL